MVKDFEELAIYQMSREQTKQVYAITRQGDFKYDSRFVQQIRAAAGSVSDNIAEGFERDGNKEFVKFLYIAKGSVGEVQSQLYNAQDLGYVTAEEMSETYDFAHRISAGIHALIRSLSAASRAGRRYEQPRNPATP